ncbi:MAG: tRNA preQ1(34) S-adenosylmethionine ribosyltransferase-isomerase QueA [Ferrovum sp.]|nr:tRNA preQ1(34) S-adenosylmethionine ribosyltransferase-isomerase QueA [Ferrovum sp.]NDU87946.1 tRNA preQ1(34) S-adenosylmethionine ribosyltransferase-isomerase QueA [Ferrovum sp.]
MNLCTSDFDYLLPPELIAQTPSMRRGESRLLHLALSGLNDTRFSALPGLVSAGDLLVFNDTRVMKARLHGQKDSGGRVEALVERVLSETEAWVQIRASHAPRPESVIHFTDGRAWRVLEKQEDLYRVWLFSPASEEVPDFVGWLDQVGELPLPPYIAHLAGEDDEHRYQTVYARHLGAVAAPTAGLHFDEEMLQRLRQQGVETASLTLHVGAGTFQPVRVERLEDHRMHAEWLQIPVETVDAIERTRARGGRVLAVGTTSLRALEGAVDERGQLQAGARETRLFITPGYRFHVVDRLLTNFHLPRSTLLMLISAFGGMTSVQRAYAHAIEQRYRFFSYGDAMLIEKDPLGGKEINP